MMQLVNSGTEAKLLEHIDLVKSGVKKFNGLKKYIATGSLETGKITDYVEVDYESKPSRANMEVKENDILFAKMKHTEKVFLISKENEVNLYSTGFAILRVKNYERVLPKYVFYWIISPFFQNKKNKECTGATQMAINESKLKKFSIPIPPIELQKKIIAILEKAKQLKEWRKESNKLTDDYLNSVFLEMFGDPKINPNKWDIYRTDDICELIRDGEHRTPTYVNTGIPFITAKNLTGDQLNTEDTKRISKEEHIEFSRRAKPERGDILMSKDGTIGATQVVKTNEEFSIFVSVILLKPKSELVDPDFLKFLFSSNAIQIEIKKRIKGIAIRHLHLVDIRSLKIPIPPIDLQKKFSKIVNQVEILKNQQTDAKGQIDNLFNVLMQKAFRGELIC